MTNDLLSSIGVLCLEQTQTGSNKLDVGGGAGCCFVLSFSTTKQQTK